MTAKLTGQKSVPSREGGMVKMVFFKELTTGKSYRTCIYPQFRNAPRWAEVLKRKGEVILDGLMLKGNVIDADSNFRIIQ